MGIVKTGVETLVPGGKALTMGGEALGKGAERGKRMVMSTLRHPYRSLAAVGITLLAGNFGLGMWQGKFEMGFTTEIDMEDEGRGTVVAIDLEIPERPLIGYTADVEGAKTVLDRGFNLGSLKIPTGTNWLDLNERVDTVVHFDPDRISAQYDPGMINDESDDRIILSVPADSFSVTNSMDPEREVYEFHGNWLNLPSEIISAYTHSFDVLKSVPGIGNIDDAGTNIETALLGMTRVKILENVANECTANVMENSTVYEAVHRNIGNAALEIIGSSGDPNLANLTVGQAANMKVDVFIGTESDAQPFMPNQTFQFENPYSEKMKKLSENPDLAFESAGNFECELSDEVKEMLGETEEAPATGTPAATPSTEAKND